MFVPRRLAIITALLVPLTLPAADKDVRISIPKRTKPTPVQKLNQEGVKELQKREYKKAKATFYKAYLIDPNDPFTLNNLGYIADSRARPTAPSATIAWRRRRAQTPSFTNRPSAPPSASLSTRSPEAPPTTRCR